MDKHGSWFWFLALFGRFAVGPANAKKEQT
jgi:hypothetical protein